MRIRALAAIGILLGYTMGMPLISPHVAHAATAQLFISELQVAGSASSAHEFVELINPAQAAVSVNGWQLKYRPSTTANGTDCSKGWVNKALVNSGSVPAGGHYLFAATGYLGGDTNFSAGLSNTAGTIRIVDAAGQTVDALAWGGAACGNGSAAAAPAAGSSLERTPSASGANNATDYAFQAQPSPQKSSGAPAPQPVPAPVPAPAPAPGAPAPSQPSSKQLEITELLIDPAAPQTDAQDEFIEIHNPSTAAVQIENYVIKTGSHRHTLPNFILGPGEYLAITSGDSSISLTNSGGVANLLNASGAVIDTAGAWEKAEAGASWALLNGVWRWTFSPTPGEKNLYTPVPGQEGMGEGGGYAPLQLTELLPDPVSPQTDAQDEYIEIFNPTSEPINLKGYTIKVGHELSSKYVLKEGVVPAGGYYVLKSATSKLALANDGSSVALYAPGGTQLGSTVIYSKAQTGNAWALVNSQWQWTGQPTPGATNILASVLAGAAAAKAAAAKTTKVKAAKTVKAKAAAKTKAAKTKNPPLIAASTTSGGQWLLLTLAGLTIAYIIYEFRYDIRNFYRKLRGNTVGRPATVPIPVGRGDDRAR